ncbi:hypothetical protein T01_15154 [Trichinella spiralis]|uniref:Uncharacterized protein n=1 Tax=Trichinella spiralis TaxID=6334 RepID=A0A0V1BQY3_TRISP|nr:hypothetical protein T01_15154 [Trichinella spiralis]
MVFLRNASGNGNENHEMSFAKKLFSFSANLYTNVCLERSVFSYSALLSFVSLLTSYYWNKSAYTSVISQVSIQISDLDGITCTLPQALPEAMPQGIKKFAYSPRLRLRHFIAQYLPSGSYAWGYASGNFSKILKFLKYSPRLCPQATPQGK